MGMCQRRGKKWWGAKSDEKKFPPRNKCPNAVASLMKSSLIIRDASRGKGRMAFSRRTKDYIATKVNMVIRSSPRSLHMYWPLSEEPEHAVVAERLCRGIDAKRANGKMVRLALRWDAVVLAACPFPSPSRIYRSGSLRKHKIRRRLPLSKPYLTAEDSIPTHSVQKTQGMTWLFLFLPRALQAGGAGPCAAGRL